MAIFLIGYFIVLGVVLMVLDSKGVFLFDTATGGYCVEVEEEETVFVKGKLKTRKVVTIYEKEI